MSPPYFAVQPFDLTTLVAVYDDVASHWLPARVDNVVQTDLSTVHLSLRTLKARQWLTLSWHPQAARLHLCEQVALSREVFQFQQLLLRLKGLALVAIQQPDPWERVLVLAFASRPGEVIQWRLYLEVMGKHSNLVLVDAANWIVGVGKGVSDRQSRVRPLQLGLTYALPPPLTQPIASRSEAYADWRSRVGADPNQLMRVYRGVSRSLVQTWLQQVHWDDSESSWLALFDAWQQWQERLQTRQFAPQRTPQGYDLLYGDPAADLHSLLADYYSEYTARLLAQRDHHALSQTLTARLSKLQQRLNDFQVMLDQADQAETAKQAADLLMANLEDWEPGLSQITLQDFERNTPIAIALNPEKNAIANAQAYYKQHRKARRARQAVEPLWQAAQADYAYTEGVLAAIEQLDPEQAGDREALSEIKQEVQPSSTTTQTPTTASYRSFSSPTGYEIWVGRNNRQNELLTFKLAQPSDWWFHAQEIPGSHVLLRLPPGAVAASEDLQAAADFAAHYSKGRHSEQVPVVYTRPKSVYKLKGAQPGMVVYKHETVIWGKPHAIHREPVLG